MHTFLAEKFIPEGMSLGIFCSHISHNVLTHKHDFLEIVYVKNGQARQYINDVCYTVSRGDLLFINYGATHTIESRGDDFEYYNISFNADLLAERIINRNNAFDLLSLTALDELRGEIGTGGILSFVGEERRLIESILTDMVAEFKRGESESRAVLESYMTVLLAKITRKLRPCQKNESSRLDMWDKLSEYIADNLDKKLTLEGVARQCFYNPSYFSRAFKERFGKTLVEYVSRERASLAASLLAETDMTVERIAEECGFGDKSALYRAFARFYGKTPSEYRGKK